LQPDITGLMIQFTGLHLKVMQSNMVCIVLDGLFVLLPSLLCVMVFRTSRGLKEMAVVTFLFHLLYAWLYSTLNIYSIEIFTAFIFTPLVFVSVQRNDFLNQLKVLRLIFLIIFFSTALWKIRAGGIWNHEQMAAILSKQHIALLAYAPDNSFTAFIHLLITHPEWAQCLYWSAFIIEFMMCIGFFTTRFDRWLLAGAILFIGMDYLLMEINYFTWIPMVATLYFTKTQRRLS
jgi:hypothetical protein